MTRLSRAVLFVLFALVLAGCTSSNTPTNTTPTGGTSADTSTEAQALALLASAAANMPDKYGMDLALTSGTKELLSIHGSFDNATGTSYAEIAGDVSTLSRGGSGGQAASVAPYLANGLTVYVTKEGSLYLANGTAFVFPAGAASGSSLVPTPDKSPIAAFLTPVNGPLKDVLAAGSIKVSSVTPTDWKGKSALRIEGTTVQDNQTIPAIVVLYTSPARLAHVESTIPTNPASPQDPIAGAKAVADFAYDNDVALHPSAAATRALGLAYRSDKSGFASFSSSGPTTWTFTNSGGIALLDVEAQVRNGSAASGDITSLPTLWTMTLADGTHTQDGVTLTFTDVDKDGKVSAGDTLKTEGSGDSPPLVLLKDKTTGTLVVPGAPLVALLGVLAAAGLLLRRRA